MASVPRLLTSAGQGYGYAVAWCLAQLLQPALVHHVHAALAAQQQQQQQLATSGPPDASSSSIHGHHEAQQYVQAEAGKQLWRLFLSQGAGLADAVALVGWVASLQEHHADVARDNSNASDYSSSSAGSVADALREQGMWFWGASGEGDGEQQTLHHPLDVLGVCLGCALARIAHVSVSR
jgi:hypothetical protein